MKSGWHMPLTTANWRDCHQKNGRQAAGQLRGGHAAQALEIRINKN
jgi:hypothetical protein